MHTFISLSELGSGKGHFTDTLTFTTTLYGHVNAKLVLEPVPKHFRLINAKLSADAKRRDIHKLTFSVAFPSVDLRDYRIDQFGTGAATGPLSAANADRIRSEVIGRAIENLCIARAINREDTFGNLRLYPPEVYCRGAAVAGLPGRI